MVPEISVSGSAERCGSWRGPVFHASKLVIAAYEFDNEAQPIL
jgi:hypothetical protein